MHVSATQYRFSLAAISMAVSLYLAPHASAQTGPELLLKPWPDKGQVADGTADDYLFQGGHTKDSGASFRLEDYETVGRFRLLPGNEISPRIGYEMRFLDNHTNNPRLPNQLSDESLAVGTGLFKYQGWIGAITLGGGYAGSRAFAEGAGWYGKADLVLAREINDNDAVGIIIDYDGHRNYLPDTPLPGIGFSHRFDPKLKVVAGLPYSSVEWKPLEPLLLMGQYNLYTDFKASVAYEFIPHLSLFASYGFVRDAFHVDGLPSDHRLLFYQRRAELGLRFTPCENFTCKAAIGYGWDGRYRSGFDFRKDTLVADVSDEPYLRVGVQWSF